MEYQCIEEQATVTSSAYLEITLQIDLDLRSLFKMI